MLRFPAFVGLIYLFSCGFKGEPWRFDVENLFKWSSVLIAYAV